MFNKTLYYPWIDIHDDSWVKTAILYWDEIKTIVPSGMASPYHNEVASLLEQERILRPFQVSPSSREVIEASEIAMQYFSTPEGMRILTLGDEHSRIHPSKFSYQLQQSLGMNGGHIHSSKMSYQLMETIGAARVNDDGFVNLDGKFSSLYMSVLANRIAKNNNLSMVADSQIYNQFNTKLSTDGYSPNNGKTFVKCPKCKVVFDRFTQESIKNTGTCPACEADIFYFFENKTDMFKPYRAEPRHIVDGMLAELVIESIYIPKSVSIDKMLKFRIDHSDELSSFRGALHEITQVVLNSGEVDDMRALRELVSVAYHDNVIPKINALKSQLKDAKVRYFLSDFSISGMASILSTTLATPSIGTTAILAGAGVSIGVRSLMYFQERNSIRTNPYSYVLSMEKKLS